MGAIRDNKDRALRVLNAVFARYLTIRCKSITKYRLNRNPNDIDFVADCDGVLATNEHLANLFYQMCSDAFNNENTVSKKQKEQLALSLGPKFKAAGIWPLEKYYVSSVVYLESRARDHQMQKMATEALTRRDLSALSRRDSSAFTLGATAEAAEENDIANLIEKLPPLERKQLAMKDRVAREAEVARIAKEEAEETELDALDAAEEVASV